jgi:hypothetical protein
MTMLENAMVKAEQVEALQNVLCWASLQHVDSEQQPVDSALLTLE